MTDENKEENHELTNVDLEIYKKEFMKWVDIFGLKGWKLYFYLRESDIAFGSCSATLIGRCATITLSKFMDKEDYSIKKVKDIAFHECCELFMARITCLAECRHTTKDEIPEEIHNIIRTMEYIKENYIEVLKKMGGSENKSKPIKKVPLDEPVDENRTIKTCGNCETNKNGDAKNCRNSDRYQFCKNWKMIEKSCKNCGRLPHKAHRFCELIQSSCTSSSDWIPISQVSKVSEKAKEKFEDRDSCEGCTHDNDCRIPCTDYQHYTTIAGEAGIVTEEAYNNLVPRDCNNCGHTKREDFCGIDCANFSAWIPPVINIDKKIQESTKCPDCFNHNPTGFCLIDCNNYSGFIQRECENCERGFFEPSQCDGCLDLSDWEPEID